GDPRLQISRRGGNATENVGQEQKCRGDNEHARQKKSQIRPDDAAHDVRRSQAHESERSSRRSCGPCQQNDCDSGSD
ncbi:hypothetical protein OLF82_11065, partial [Streptococcus pneumoniae]|nr:hypothetical protein [Streptococcus pneumoniae]